MCGPTKIRCLRRQWRVASCAAIALALGACGPPSPRLVLLVSVDTLRADRLGAYGSDRGLTPHLDALAAEATVFEAAYAPASFTLPAVAAMLSGREPEDVGIRDNKSVLDASVVTLAEVLRAHGWSTTAVVSNFVLRRASGLDAGFDAFDDAFPQQEARRNMPERTAAATTDALLAAVDACVAVAGRGCFAWGHYQDPHGPYTPPDGYRERELGRDREAPGGRRRLPVRRGPAGLGGIPNYQYLDGHDEVAWYRAGYHGEIAFTDAEIGRLLAGLAERGLADAALIAFAGDHGEGLGENDYWFSHGRLLSEPLVRIPLLLRVPGRPPARRGDVAALHDLTPTILAQLGLPAPAGLAGRDLLAPGAADAGRGLYLAALGGAPVPRYAWVEGRFKLVVSEVEGGVRQALFLRDREAVNLASSAPEKARELRARLDAHRARYAARAPAAAQDLSDRDRARLEALGYGE